MPHRIAVTLLAFLSVAVGGERVRAEGTIEVRLVDVPAEAIVAYVADVGVPKLLSVDRAQTISALLKDKCGYESQAFVASLRKLNGAFDSTANLKGTGRQADKDLLSVDLNTFLAGDDTIKFPACLRFEKHRVLVADDRGVTGFVNDLKFSDSQPFPAVRASSLARVVGQFNGYQLRAVSGNCDIAGLLRNDVVTIPISSVDSSFQVATEANATEVAETLQSKFEQQFGPVPEPTNCDVSKGQALAGLQREVGKPRASTERVVTSGKRIEEDCSGVGADDEIIRNMAAALADLPTKSNYQKNLPQPVPLAIVDSGLFEATTNPVFRKYLTHICQSEEDDSCLVKESFDEDGAPGPSMCGTTLLQSHGTIVATLALGGLDVVKRQSGAPAPATAVMPFRLATSCTDPNERDLVTPRAISAALDWTMSLDNRASPQIINISWLFPKKPSFTTALERLKAYRMLVVAAAGNQDSYMNYCCEKSPNKSTPSGSVYPAALGGELGNSNILVVGAADRTHRKIWKGSNHGPSVDLYAPGQCVPSWARNGSALYSGTSVAAPIVSFTAAMLMRVRPTSTLGATGKDAHKAIQWRILASADLPEVEDAVTVNPSPFYNRYQDLHKFLNVKRAVNVDRDQVRLAEAKQWKEGRISILSDTEFLCADTPDNYKRHSEAAKFKIKDVYGLFREGTYMHIIPTPERGAMFACELNKQLKFRIGDGNEPVEELDLGKIDRLVTKWQ